MINDKSAEHVLLLFLMLCGLLLIRIFTVAEFRRRYVAVFHIGDRMYAREIASLAVLTAVTMVAIGQVVRRSLEADFDALLRRDLVELRKILRENSDVAILVERLTNWVEDNDEVGFAEVRRQGKVTWRSTPSRWRRSST